MKCKLWEVAKYWMPPIVYAILIYYLSSRSSVDIGPEIPHIDKFYHALIYFIFALLLWRAFYHASPTFTSKRAIWFALIVTILFGMSDEWHQFYVSFRHADVFDLLFDTAGASLALISVSWWNNGQKKGKNHLDQ